MIDTSLLERNLAVMRNEDNCGNVSDGDHTFAELYRHRAVLAAAVFNAHPTMAWKSKLHEDGAMYDGYFIVGIETPYGQATYHYAMDCWDMFRVCELERAPAWDGHTPDEAIERIRRTFCDTENENASVLKNGLLIIQTGLRLHSTQYETLRHDILEQMKSGLVILPRSYEAVYIPADTKVRVGK